VAKYKFKTKPYTHQIEALKVLLRNRGGALFMEMGTGKSKVCIDWVAAEAVRLDERAPGVRCLITCPLSVVGVWPKEIAKHDPFADNDYMGAEYRIVNYDKVWRPHVYDELVEWLCEVPPEKRLIIADESHKIKTHSSRRSKAMHRLGHYTEKKVIASGTPVTNKNTLDLFSQFKFLRESIFGTHFDHFKQKVAVFKWNSPVIHRFKNKRWVRKKTKHLVYRIKKDECLDLPPRTHEIIPVFLEPQARRVYDQLAEQAITEWAGMEVEAPHVLTRMMRLSQITGGWLKGDEGYRKISNVKIEKLKELLDDFQDNERQKLVIYARFKKELIDIRKAVKETNHYYVLTIRGKNRKRRERIYEAFEAIDLPTVLVVQLATGSEGRNELVVAREAVFFSHDQSMVHFHQALDRLHRPGQLHKVTYYHLLADLTQDPLILLGLRENFRAAEMALKYPKMLHSSADTAQVQERRHGKKKREKAGRRKEKAEVRRGR
jgi:SNF2 family DNA or RNA helicase